MRWLLVVGLAAGNLLRAGAAADVARSLHDLSFDRSECYRVRDLTIFKQDLKIYLTDGHLIFSKPVAGRRIAAVFSNDVDSGDGEVMLLPPDRAERASLASYINSPNLDEHFRAAVFLFTGRVRCHRFPVPQESRQPQGSRSSAGDGRSVDPYATRLGRQFPDPRGARSARRSRRPSRGLCRHV